MTKLLFSYFLTLSLILIPTVEAHTCHTDEVSILKYDLCVLPQWIVGPYFNGRGERVSSELQLTFRALHGEIENIDLAKSKLYPWMIMQGGHQHGARPVTLEINSPDQVIVTNILLSQMNGQWFFRLSLVPKIPWQPQSDFDAEFEITI